MTESELIQHPPVREGSSIRLSAELKSQGADSVQLWYEIPADLESRLTGGSDPFVIGMIFTIMGMGRPVRIRGTVAPSLLRNLDELMAVWHAWHPDLYHRVEITADDETEGQREWGKPAVSGFSGGLDSCYTAWWHHRGPGGRQRKDLRAGIFVRGFDIPLAEAAGFQKALANNRVILDSVGMELLPLATNFREQPIDWEDSHASGLASCMALFRGQFSNGLIASTFTYDVIGIKWGSTPFTDRLLSSDGLAIQTDAADVDRQAKVRALTNWPEAMQHMRVCWEGIARDANCCRCEKCIRTMLAFRIIGHPLPPCFPHDATDEQIRNLRPNQPVAAAALCNLLQHAREAGLGKESWVRALAAATNKFTPGNTPSLAARILGSIGIR